MKKREIKPLSFIFFQTLKTPLIKNQKKEKTHTEKHICTKKKKKQQTTTTTTKNPTTQYPTPPLTKLDGCYYRNDNRLTRHRKSCVELRFCRLPVL